jgi:hypothetical protein
MRSSSIAWMTLGRNRCLEKTQKSRGARSSVRVRELVMLRATRTYPLCSTHPSPALVSNTTLWLHLCATRRALMAAFSSCVSCVTSQPGRRSVASTSKQYCSAGAEREQGRAGRATRAGRARRRRTCRVSTVVAISVSSQSKTITVSPSTAPLSASVLLIAGSTFTGEAGGELGGVSGARVCLHGGALLDSAEPASGSSASSSGAIPLNSASRLTAEQAVGVLGATTASSPALPPATPHRSRAGSGVGTAIVSLCCVGIGLGVAWLAILPWRGVAWRTS